jgi:hypothetical protein
MEKLAEEKYTNIEIWVCEDCPCKPLLQTELTACMNSEMNVQHQAGEFAIEWVCFSTCARGENSKSEVCLNQAVIGALKTLLEARALGTTYVE